MRSSTGSTVYGFRPTAAGTRRLSARSYADILVSEPIRRSATLIPNSRVTAKTSRPSMASTYPAKWSSHARMESLGISWWYLRYASSTSGGTSWWFGSQNCATRWYHPETVFAIQEPTITRRASSNVGIDVRSPRCVS